MPKDEEKEKKPKKTIDDLKSIDQKLWRKIVHSSGRADPMGIGLTTSRRGRQPADEELAFRMLKRTPVGRTVTGMALFDAINEIQENHRPSTWTLDKATEDEEAYVMTYVGAKEEILEASGNDLIEVLLNLYSQLVEKYGPVK